MVAPSFIAVLANHVCASNGKNYDLFTPTKTILNTEVYHMKDGGAKLQVKKSSAGDFNAHCGL